MRSGASIWAIGLLFAVLAAGSPAYAQDEGEWGPHDRVVAGQIQPLDRILPEVRRSHPGTFYDAEGPFTGADGEMHYRLKWMTPDGRIVWFDANARTGRVMGTGGGRYQNYDYGPPRGDRYRDQENDDRDRYGPGYNGGPGYDRGPGDYDSHGGQGPDWGQGRGGWGGGRGGWPDGGGNGGRGGWQGGGGHGGGHWQGGGGGHGGHGGGHGGHGG